MTPHRRFAAVVDVLVYAAKSAIAAGLSWYVAADLLHNHIPVFAPLAALLTLQVTIRDSVSRGLERVLGVIVGVLVAFGFARLAGIHAWSIGLIIFVGLLIGRVLRLGPQGSVQVPVSALLVLAVGSTRGGYGTERISDTALGAAIGILVASVAIPTGAVDEAAEAVRSLAASLAGLLREMAGGLRQGPLDASYLGIARRLGQEKTNVAGIIGEADRSLQWNPSGRQNRLAVERLHRAMATLDLVEIQVRGIARTIADSTGRWTMPPEAAAPVADLLGFVAGWLEGWVDGAAAGPQDHHRYEAALSAVQTAGLPILAAAGALAIAVDARRILDELSASRPDMEKAPPQERPFP